MTPKACYIHHIVHKGPRFLLGQSLQLNRTFLSPSYQGEVGYVSFLKENGERGAEVPVHLAHWTQLWVLSLSPRRGKAHGPLELWFLDLEPKGQPKESPDLGDQNCRTQLKFTRVLQSLPPQLPHPAITIMVPTY